MDWNKLFRASRTLFMSRILRLVRKRPPASVAEARRMSNAVLMGHLRMLAQAYRNELSGAPKELDSWDKWKLSTRAIGEALNERGGFSLMVQALDVDLLQMAGCRGIETHWDGIGKWRG